MYNNIMIRLKVTAIGNSQGVILPKEAVSRLGVKKGDELFLVEDQEGYVMTAFDPRVAEQLEAADSVIRRYRNALKELAK